MTTKIIRNCSILDDSFPTGYVDHQDILIQGNRIEEIRPTGLPAGDVQEFDCTSYLAIPGIINSHTHSPENVLRGTTERLPLEPWLVAQFSFLPNFPEELIYLITLAGCAEMLHSGVTSVLDHFSMPEGLSLAGLNSAMEAYSLSGIRVKLAPMVEDRDSILPKVSSVYPALKEFRSTDLPSSSHLLSIVDEFLYTWQGKFNGRLRGMPGPGGLQWCSDELLEGCVELAEKYDTGIHLHLSETRLQTMVCQEEYGSPATMHLQQMNIFNRPTSVAHAVWITDEELNVLANNDVTVVHNPVSNLKLGSGIARVSEMIKRGVRVALGSDGAGSNDNQDMWGVMKLAALLHSPGVHKQPDWLSARQVLTMATSAGAQVIAPLEKLGAIKPGFLADITLINKNRTFHTPIQDAFCMLVFTATSDSVQHVMVDGEWIVWNKKITPFNEDDLYNELSQKIDLFFRTHPKPTSEFESLINAWKKGLQIMKLNEDKNG